MDRIDWREALICLFALYLAGACAYTDWTVQKIPNRKTFFAMGIGLLLNLLFWGIHGLANSVLGILLGFALILLFILGALKAGDVKLYMALGAVLGYHMNFKIIVSSILIGGVAGILLMILRQNGRKRFVRLWLYFQSLILGREFWKYEADGKDGVFSFGVCIAAGTFLVILTSWTGRFI